MTDRSRADRSMSERSDTAFAGFGPDLVAFYEGLDADNSREYWQAHKSVYDEQVGGPAKALAATLTQEFGTVKVFRPYRDLRFSSDKSPYKIGVSMARDVGGGGVLYFAVTPDAVDLAGGMYQPGRDQLLRFRELQDDPPAVRSLDAVLAGLDEQEFSLMEEGSLATAPRGWSADHPRIAMLRLTHIAVGQAREPGAWLHDRGCLDEIADAWRVLEGWNAWLATHVGMPDMA